jgi:hypothetical protein
MSDFSSNFRRPFPFLAVFISFYKLSFVLKRFIYNSDFFPFRLAGLEFFGRFYLLRVRAGCFYFYLRRPFCGGSFRSLFFAS